MPTVAFVQRRLPHYRVALLEGMRKQLAPSGVTLRFLHGEPSRAESSKRDSGTLSWAEPLPTLYLAGGRICWQPFHARVKDCDLVIVSQENKLINNLTALFNPFRPYRFAFLGHGGNLQSANPGSWREHFKRWTHHRADWWFPYTDMSAQRILASGFSPERITVLDNSVDTAGLRRAVEQARQEEPRARRERLGLGEGPLGLFLGSLYEDKLLPQLIDSAVEVHRQNPDFILAIAGDGPQRPMVERAVAQHPFIRYIGPVHGAHKADLLSCADLLLNPGLVGLGILDAFAAGVPIVTTDCGLHSPEIAYLDHQVNGLMTEASVPAFSRAVLALLQDRDFLKRLQAGAQASGSRYTIERMTDNFCQGILRCLETGRREAG